MGWPGPGPGLNFRVINLAGLGLVDNSVGWQTNQFD